MREKGSQRRGRTTLRTIVAAVAAVALSLAVVPATADEVDSTLQITGFRSGAQIRGALPTDGPSQADPSVPYPDDVPSTGFGSTRNFQTGLFVATGNVSNDALLYCVDIATPTAAGNGYELGTWSEANIANAGYVARILADFYPNTGAPSGSDAAKITAVQSAIWYFSDGLVLTAGDSARAQTAAIVAHALQAGTLPEPAPPTLTITAPGDPTAMADEAVGPFVVDSSFDATVFAVNGTMWRDAEGADQIPDGSTVTPGTGIYLRADAGATSVTLTAHGTVTFRGGTTALYDKNGDAQSAQKLILSKPTQFAATAEATAQFTAFGSLILDKSIVGDGADIHEEIALHVSGSNGLEDDFIIPAGTTGTVSKTWERIPLGTTVTITEPGDGTFPGLVVDVQGLGTTVVDQQGENHVRIENRYATRFGSVEVVKSIDGSGAGLQDDVTLHISGTNGLEDDFVIPAGSTGDTSKVYDGLPEGTVITVTETADGANGSVTCTVTEGEPVTISANEVVGIEFVNTYDEILGSVEITKTITGKGAGLQGDVVLHVTGTNGLERDITIPAGTTGETSVVIDGIPVGTEITVAETRDGGNGRVTVTVSEWDTAVVAADEIVRIDVVNTYSERKGILAWTGMAPIVLPGLIGLGAVLLAGGGVATVIAKRHQR